MDFATIEKTLKEIVRIMNEGGNLLLTTPNNARYHSTKLNYNELKNALNDYFAKFSIFFYNTLPKLSNKSRKLNLANIIPKLESKIVKDTTVQHSLLKKDEGREKNSVSFYVEAIK